MLIQSTRTVGELQQEFHAVFPGLKLGFYQKEHQDHQGSPRKMEYASEVLLAKIQPNLTVGEMPLNAEQSVADFEQQMESRFGLHVQVFRKSNNLWLQTTSTDDWTLGVQNRKGLHSTQVIQ
ncbi:hypothetical protein [Lewinella sp. LCG006]|uniref:hypothetical protein n=1 Tax=Lewinella sp. LCG006 TaxID=3231911 RepID=UPI00345F8038